MIFSFTLFFLPLTAMACPIPIIAETPPATTGVTVAQVLAAVPGAASCSSSGPSSCRTAEQATPFLNKAFTKYGFTTPGEQAALLSLMAYESGDFLFDVNVSQNTAGQGTRNMMMFPFILQYALEFASSGVSSIAPSLSSGSSFDDINNTPADTKNAIRALVLDDELSFGSASWFLREKCSPDIAEGLKSMTADAFGRYITDCVGTTNGDDRLQRYRSALTALGA